MCFLTRVTGAFKGFGEWVYVYRSNGSWWLGGGSQQAGVAASARCVNTIYRAGPYSWQSNQQPVSMASTSEWACGLTMVQGELVTYSLGSDDSNAPEVTAWTSASFDPSNQWWELRGYNQSGAIASRAYCM